MRRGRPLQRRTPLAAGTSQLRRSPLRSSAQLRAAPRSAAQSSDTGPSAKVRRKCYQRDGWRCQRCGRAGQLTLQHRIGRGMGGTNPARANKPSNLVSMCGSGTTGCHGWAELGPREDVERAGFSLRRANVDPRTVPYRRFDGVAVLLDDEYQISYPEGQAA